MRFSGNDYKVSERRNDLIFTKSISRFARNTVDTLNHVRMLRDKNIEVFFEKENINTLDMNGELLLTIMSSLSQQEVESLSQNVKMGLKMKMKRGEVSWHTHGVMGMIKNEKYKGDLLLGKNIYS